MKTYQIQYIGKDGWQVASAPDGTPLEFIAESHAQYVAGIMASLGFQLGFPTRPSLSDWRIQDSSGKYQALNGWVNVTLPHKIA